MKVIYLGQFPDDHFSDRVHVRPAREQKSWRNFSIMLCSSFHLASFSARYHDISVLFNCFLCSVTVHVKRIIIAMLFVHYMLIVVFYWFCNCLCPVNTCHVLCIACRMLFDVTYIFALFLPVRCFRYSYICTPRSQVAAQSGKGVM